MNEQEILSQAKINTPSEPYIEPTLETPVVADIDIQSKIDLFGQMGVDMQLLNDPETNSKIGDIYEWAKSINPQIDSLGMAMMVQELMTKIGRTDKGYLQNIWDYIQIDRQIKLLTERKHGFLNGR